MSEPENNLTDDSMESMVAQAVDEFLDSASEGARPDVDSFVERYPEIADVLRGVLPAVQAMQPDADATLGSDLTGAPMIEGCLGDYRIVQEVGRGGMGIVYEAEQISLKRRVALKVLPFAASLDPNRLDRFKNEAQAAARLHHSNIVPVYAVGCERGVYYYAMQMIDGHTLADVIAHFRQKEIVSSTRSAKEVTRSVGEEHEADSSDSSLTLRVSNNDETIAVGALSTVHSQSVPGFIRMVAELGVQAADALDHAHNMDVVHRDIKPANLMVDERGHLWITDFGLARLVSDGGLTMTGDIVGTFRYMSPEQANGNPGGIDHHSDIYSLGATLYELLTFEPAIAGESREQLMHAITENEPVAPRRRNAAIPMDLETIILKAMSKEPSSRYATAGALADDLRRFLDDRPILARRPSLVERASKWSRRHKTLVGAAAVILVLSVVGLAVSNVLIAREKAKTDRAYEEVALKQEATAAALAEEARQRELAEKNFRQAREMLDEFVEISEADLNEAADLQELRGSLLESALSYYREFIEQAQDNPPLQAELAASHLRVSQILEEIGAAQEAETALDLAVAAQEDLVRKRPGDPDLRRGLVNMYRQKGLFRGRMDTMLIEMDSVQTHLKMTDEQIAQIEDLVRRQRDAERELIESDDVDFKEIQRGLQGRVQIAQDELRDVLDDEQLSRLNQIVLQRRGVSALGDPQIAKQLQLSEAQRQKIRQTQSARIHGPPARRGGPREHGPPRFKRDDEQILTLLTDTQRVQWEEMIGESFQFKKPHPPFGRGRKKK